MIHRKREIPWIKIVQFHAEIARRDEEVFFALPLSEPDSGRWSSLKEFNPISFSGPWSISQGAVVSQQLARSIRGEGLSKLFLGGPSWFKWRRDDSRSQGNLTLDWQPVIYREVRVELDSENGFQIVPERGSWDISPLVIKFMEQKCIQSSEPMDKLLPDIIEKASLKSEKDERDLTDCFIEELRRIIPDLGDELSKEFPKGKVKSLPSRWILFTAPNTTTSGYNKNLMHDYERLEKQLKSDPDQIGGLKLLEEFPIVREPIFSWNEVPGNDTAQFIEFLIQNFGVTWAREAEVEKSDDDKTISVSAENNSISISINSDEKKASLTINNKITDEFVLKKEDGKLNVYSHVDILQVVTLNDCQQEAVTGILKLKPVTVISGPPGCGKSQVVVSLLLNAWAKGKSVLFASQVNQAVDVVYDRLESFESGYPIAIRAGNAKENNIQEALHRILINISSGKRSNRTENSSRTKKLQELSSKKILLQEKLDSKIPQRVDQALRSAVNAYGQYKKAVQEFNEARELQAKETKELGYDIVPDEFSTRVSKPLRSWLEKIKEYHKRIEQDSRDRSDLLNRATNSVNARNIAVQQAGLDSSSVTNWNWLVSGPGPELIEAWLEDYRSLLSQPIEQRLAQKEWDEVFDSWKGETDACSWSQAGRQLVKDIKRTRSELSSKIAEIEDIKNRFDEQSCIIMEAGIPADIQVDLTLLSEWLSVYALEHSLPEGKFDWCPWSQRSKIIRKLQSMEFNIRPAYPLSIWLKIGELNKTGRETLSRTIESSRNWITVRNLWNEKKNVLEEIENRLGSLRDSATQLHMDNIPAGTDLQAYIMIAGTIEDRANVADRAAVAWNKKDIAEQTKERLREIAINFLSLASGVPLKEAWMKGPGYAFLQSVSMLGDNPIQANIVAARTSLYNESIAVLLKAWHEARSTEMDFRTHIAAAEKVPNELSRINDWWNEKPLLVSLQRADCSTLPGSDDELWKHLQACEERDARWKYYIERILPDKEKKRNDESSWAISHLKIAFETIPEGPDKVKIGQKVTPLLDGHEKSWNMDELLEIFSSFSPDRIKGQIGAIDAQLASLSFDIAKANRFKDIADDVDAQIALDALLNHYIKNYNRIEGFSHDLFTKALRAAPIWITTLQSTSSIPMQPETFDILVIDEATQCTLTNLLPMIYRAKRIAVIGDPEQLPAITTVGYETQKSLAAKLGMAEWLDMLGHAGNDAYKSAVKCLPGMRADVISLVEHYRSHPLIIGFVNQHIYQKRLRLRKDPTQTKLERCAGIHGQQVNGYCVRGPRDESWINPPEKDAVCDLVKQLRAREGFGALTIGVVTPFKAQVSDIMAKLDEMGLNGISVGTAHKYQGDERDIIVFSPVVAKGISEGAARFVEKPHNLINVAVTRAREALFVVGDLAYCERQEGILGKLVKYVRTVSKLRNTSLDELELFSWMVVQGWDPEVHVQVGDHEVDFVLRNRGIKVAIEVDGETIIKQDGEVEETHEKFKDASIDASLIGKGYKVRHVKTRSIRETPDDVIHDIAKTLELDWEDT